MRDGRRVNSFIEAGNYPFLNRQGKRLEKNPRFFHLNKDESISKLSQLLLDNNITVQVWKEKQSRKFSFLPVNFDKVLTCLNLRSTKKIDIPISRGEVNVSFFLNGVQYFSAGVIEKSDFSFITISFGKGLYRWERRENERVVAYPTHRIFVQFWKQNLNIHELENLIDFRKKESEKDDLFKEFLAWESKNESVSLKEIDGLYFRVHELSSSGVSFLIPEYLKQVFLKDAKLKNFLLKFDETKVDIKLGRVVFAIPWVDEVRPNISLLKIAVEFTEFLGSQKKLLGVKIENILENKRHYD